MKTFYSLEYDQLLSLGLDEPLDKIACADLLNGFSAHLDNPILDKVAHLADAFGHPIELHNSYVFGNQIGKKYPQIKFKHVFLKKLQEFQNYHIHPLRTHSKFLCSFNGSAHVGRKLLVAALARFGFFDHETCSKNFQFTVEKIDGHLADYLDEPLHRFYRSFFIAKDSEGFFQTLYSLGNDWNRFDHTSNISRLEYALTNCFLHLVSESLPTSYYPFVSEKFLYSVVTRGLFLTFAQPDWHNHVEKYFGFKRYTNIFDYRFDTIKNPVERLVELMTMISKFNRLSPDDWRDLYEIEKDTIEYNYQHYFSGKYVDHLNQHVTFSELSFYK